MKVVLEIQRSNPETGQAPEFQTYEVEAEPADRILDVLMRIKMFQDGTLAFRKSCAHGVCGSDAMIINGKERLACKTLVREVAEADGAVVKIEPISGFRVERDLIVDQNIFFEKYQSVKPFLINEEPVEEKEKLQTPEERGAFDDATNCILCLSCFSACPQLEEYPSFLGPAIIAQASRFLDDSRDDGFEERLEILDSPNGVWRCENRFECTKVCPRSIKVTKRINETKRRIQKYREAHGEEVND